MKLIVCKDYDEVSQEAAKIFEEQIERKPDSVLCLATGSTPLGLYRELSRANQAGGVDFSEVKTVNLDEYVGLEPTHPQSYRYFMNENFFNHINIKKENTHVPNGLGWAPNECAAYDDLIEKLGGIDLALLGSGLNGHIGFNEPADTLCARTHVTDLTESTIEAKSRFFETKGDVPTKAVTMGMGNILCAKKIVILITGEEKRPIVQAMIDKQFSVTTQIPATLLKLHPDVTLICDRAAFQKG